MAGRIGRVKNFAAMTVAAPEPARCDLGCRCVFPATVAGQAESRRQVFMVLARLIHPSVPELETPGIERKPSRFAAYIHEDQSKLS